MNTSKLLFKIIVVSQVMCELEERWSDTRKESIDSCDDQHVNLSTFFNCVNYYFKLSKFILLKVINPSGTLFFFS